MIPIPIPGAQSLGHTLFTLLLAVGPALIAGWTDRRLLTRTDDPALPELLAHRRRVIVRSVSVALGLMIVFGGTSAAWGIPLLIAFLIAIGYPLRRRVRGETWGFGRYLWYMTASIVGSFGFWMALCFESSVVSGVLAALGPERRWLAVVIAALVAAALVAWEAWYPSVWLRAHAAERLTSDVLMPRFDEIVRRAGTVTPQVYRVGAKGSRFVNAFALPSVHRPSVAMGNALLDLLEPDESAAIFAHEVAHFDHLNARYVRRAQLVNRLLIVTGAVLPILGAYTGGTWTQWIGWVWPIVVLIAVGRRAAKSQQHETESDLRAASLCGDPEAVVRALVKLHAHAQIPRRYAVDMEHAASHPSLVRRIQAIRGAAPTGSPSERLTESTVVRSIKEGTWVALDETRSYWLDGVPAGTEATLAALRDAASSYRAVNYQDLVELRVAASNDTRTLTARTRAGDRWSVPIASDDVGRIQKTLDVVDLRLAKAAATPARVPPRLIASGALVAAILAGQVGVILVPILLAMSRPSAPALAALGAMGLVRAVFGTLGGSGWLEAEASRFGLAALAGVAALAIYFAIRLARTDERNRHLRLTIGVLGAIVVLSGAWAIASAPASMRAGSGSPAMLALATALVGLGAALAVVRTRWSRPAAVGGLVLATVVGVVGVDRDGIRLRRALQQTTAHATVRAESPIGGMATDLRVSPNGVHFLALRVPTVMRNVTAARPTLIGGRIGGTVRDIAGSTADFIDNGRLLVVTALDRGVEVRIDSADDGAVAFVDTIPELALSDPRLVIDHAAERWSIVGSDLDTDATIVVAGQIGERSAARRVSSPDTIPIASNPIVFDSGATLIVPSFRRSAESPRSRALSPLSVLVSGFELPSVELWRIHGDSIRTIGHMRGSAQCGAAVDGIAACGAAVFNETSLYTVTASGELTEVARLRATQLAAPTVGPGLSAVSSAFDHAVAIIDLAARRLTRVELPPNTRFATEAVAGRGWLATLSYRDGQRGVVTAFQLTR